MENSPIKPVKPPVKPNPLVKPKTPVKPKTQVKPKPPVKLKIKTKKLNGITIESEKITSEIDETRYSEKLKNLLIKIKSQSQCDSNIKIRFGWKSN